MNKLGIESAPADAMPGALTISGAQPVWMTLDEARERSFTGELVFEGDPEVGVYLDNGVVYYAERSSDAPLGQRLVAARVIDGEQLARGTVRVGDLEHLGRMFDRDATIDRDAVLVVTETSTEDLVADLANRVVTTVRVTAYRHHPSGVHRWFLGAPEWGAGAAAASEPRTLAPVATPIGGLDDFAIEWDSFDDEEGGAAALDELDQFELVMFDPFRDIEVDEVDDTDDTEVRFDDAPAEPTPATEELADFAFEMTWPDGSRELIAPSDDAEPVAPVAEPVEPTLTFEMPMLELSDDPAAADDVPDDVAAAVRRAIAAIEAAAVGSVETEVAAAAPAVASDSPTIAELATQASDPAPSPVVDAPAAPSFGAFAPPTPDMSAEVIYARMAADMVGEALAEAMPTSTTTEVPVTAAPEVSQVATPAVATANVATAGVTPDVAATTEGPDDRTSALRRLIGSLRRKDR
jgi:hypothetical protein